MKTGYPSASTGMDQQSAVSIGTDKCVSIEADHLSAIYTKAGYLYNNAVSVHTIIL